MLLLNFKIKIFLFIILFLFFSNLYVLVCLYFAVYRESL